MLLNIAPPCDLAGLLAQAAAQWAAAGVGGSTRVSEAFSPLGARLHRIEQARPRPSCPMPPFFCRRVRSSLHHLRRHPSV